MKISLKFLPKFRINNIQVVVQIMVRRRPGDKLLSEPMMFIDVYWFVIWPEWATWFHLGFCLSQRFFFYTHAVNMLISPFYSTENVITLALAKLNGSNLSENFIPIL